MSDAHWMKHEHHSCDVELEARELEFAYGKHALVLNGISAQISPGSFLAILGMNGSGKSTLLSCLDDILQPQKGSVILAGRALADYSRDERARHIAFVAQHSHANGVTVYDALMLGRKPYIKAAPSSEDHQVVQRVLEELNLEPLALRYLDELSGGEYQKVVIARALVQDTQVLLLDEPTNNLDLGNQVEVMELIHHISRGHGIACAAVMHDINLALRYCDRFLVVKDGSVLASGTQEVISKEVIEEAYDTRVDIIEHEGGRLVVPCAHHHTETHTETKGRGKA